MAEMAERMRRAHMQILQERLILMKMYSPPSRSVEPLFHRCLDRLADWADWLVVLYVLGWVTIYGSAIFFFVVLWLAAFAVSAGFLR